LIIINSTSFVDRNVTNGQSYYYKVSASNAAGEGPLSIELRALPSKPLDLTTAVLIVLVAIVIATSVIVLFMAKHNRR
jgi:hypothetical protein